MTRQENRSLVGNAQDEDQLKKARRREKRGRERELEDVRTLLNTGSGRRYLWKLLARCGVYERSFAGDPYTTAYNEGERNIGLRVLADITEADPNALVEMMTISEESAEED